jgi:hypothetical protein
MVTNPATLARDLITQLHQAHLTHSRPAGLEPALCAYVEFWGERGADAEKIREVTQGFVTRVSDEYRSINELDAAAFDAMTNEILAHCLSLIHADGTA